MLEREPLIRKLKEFLTSRVLVLVDSNVDALYPHYFDFLPSPRFECQTMVVSAGEKSKSIEEVTRIWERMMDFGMDRRDTLILFGGGMVCDLGGFAAATFKRGVHVVNCPTTLLAMIDAAVGGKTGINFEHIKNGIGVIRQPDYIMPANTAFLRTLADSELKSGFGEMIKYAIIASPKLFEDLCELKTLTADSIKPEWIEWCEDYKQKVVAIDPEDRQERRVLNFGHTIGHALESYYLSIGQPITHGEAVAIGMVYESRLSEKVISLPHHQYLQIQNLIQKYFDIPELSEDLFNNLLPFLEQDKKNSMHRINFTLLEEIGKPSTNIFIPKELLINSLLTC